MSTTFKRECPNCSRPMSICDGSSCGEGPHFYPHWICDGPNEHTSEEGCYELLPITSRALIRDWYNNT
jgi:hypothetical protein